MLKFKVYLFERFFTIEGNSRLIVTDKKYKKYHLEKKFNKISRRMKFLQKTGIFHDTTRKAQKSGK